MTGKCLTKDYKLFQGGRTSSTAEKPRGGKHRVETSKYHPWYTERVRVGVSKILNILSGGGLSDDGEKMLRITAV